MITNFSGIFNKILLIRAVKLRTMVWNYFCISILRNNISIKTESGQNTFYQWVEVGRCYHGYESGLVEVIRTDMKGGLKWKRDVGMTQLDSGIPRAGRHNCARECGREYVTNCIAYVVCSLCGVLYRVMCKGCQLIDDFSALYIYIWNL
jgi:hypothetical protein